jgi:monoamine oxidase
MPGQRSTARAAARARHDADVVVVGAGAAGLMAAQLLCAARRSVIVLEARHRVGGRICTERVPGAPVPIELGAEFVHGRAEETLAIVRAGGLTLCRVTDAHLVALGGRLRARAALFARVAEVAGQLGRGPRDRSVAEALHAQRITGERRVVVEGFAQGFNAADLDRFSARAFAAEHGEDDPRQRDQLRILSGYDAVIAALRGKLPDDRCTLSLGRVVRRVRWRRRMVEVESVAADGAIDRVRAGAVVITLPIGVLRAEEGATGSVRFEPALPPDKARALARIEMGHALRLTLRFRDNPGWPPELGFVHARGQAVPVWWTPAPVEAPMITGWAGGPMARRLLELDDAALVARALDALAATLGLPRARLGRLLDGAHFHRWDADPFARGAYSYIGVGGTRAPRALGRPEAGTLFFAGEATDPDRSGTVAGALASGRRAAAQVLDAR